MRRVAVALALAAILSTPLGARADHELGKARAKVIAGSIFTAIGVSAVAIGFGFLGADATSNCSCGGGSFIAIILEPLAAAHLAVGIPVLAVGVRDYKAAQPRPFAPGIGSPSFY